MKQSRYVWLAGLAAAFVVAGPAKGLMPPPPAISVTVVGDSPEAQAQGEALATILGELGWFAAAPHDIDRTALRTCTDRPAELEACLRKSDGWKAGRAAVLILANGSPIQKWTCVSVAAVPKAPERQTVTIDLRQAIFGTPEKRFPLRNQAAACIMAAASEGGW